uniref:Uncharacterized protein n=1 Tax=Callorhinchus milii TaxID=7868 RepID=A0A4W3IXA8_CALMI
MRGSCCLDICAPGVMVRFVWGVMYRSLGVRLVLHGTAFLLGQKVSTRHPQSHAKLLPSVCIPSLSSPGFMESCSSMVRALTLQARDLDSILSRMKPWASFLTPHA